MIDNQTKEQPDIKEVIDLVNKSRLIIKGRLITEAEARQLQEENRFNNIIPTFSGPELNGYLITLTKSPALIKILELFETDHPLKKEIDHEREDRLPSSYGNFAFALGKRPKTRPYYFASFVRDLREERLLFLLWKQPRYFLFLKDYEEVLELLEALAKIKTILERNLSTILNKSFEINLNLRVKE